MEAGVSGNSRLPYKFVGISHEFIRQKGIPAHPWQKETYLDTFVILSLTNAVLLVSFQLVYPKFNCTR